MLATFRQAADLHAYPASTLTDIGMVYTVRFAGGRTLLEHERRRLRIVQKNSRPNHPTTCGKVERFQQTMKKWLRHQPDQPDQHRRAPDAARRLDRHLQPAAAAPITAPSGHPRHHLPRTPGSHPGRADRSSETHDWVRHDTIERSGCVTVRHGDLLRHIGIGRTHARTRVILFVKDLHIRVLNATTGELLRDLVLDTSRDYQPTGRLPGRTPK